MTAVGRRMRLDDGGYTSFLFDIFTLMEHYTYDTYVMAIDLTPEQIVKESQNITIYDRT